MDDIFKSQQLISMLTNLQEVSFLTLRQFQIKVFKKPARTKKNGPSSGPSH
jgi:hypothetical protein